MASETKDASVAEHGARQHAKLSPSTLKSRAICPGFRNDPDGDKTAADNAAAENAVIETNLDDCAAELAGARYLSIVRVELFVKADEPMQLE